MVKDFSPEEKLLNLIKRKKIKAPFFVKKDDLGIPKPGLAGPSKNQRAFLSRLDLGNIIKIENIKVLNTFLVVMLMVIILYLFIDIFLIPSKEIAPPEERPPKAPPVKEIEIKPYSYYSKELAKAVFQPLVRDDTAVLKPEIPLEELMGNLALLGIVSGERPQAIIEDKSQKKTFFLREGQSAGGIFLKRIEDGSVTVVYKDEEFNLTL